MIALALAATATLLVAGRGSLNPPDPWAGIGAVMPGTVLWSHPDPQAPMGWALYQDEEGLYWMVRYLECDRYRGFSCPREELYRNPVRREKP